MNNKFKIDVVKDGSFVNGICSVTGQVPKSRPYVWIGDDERGCLATLDGRQMNMLIKRWQRANKAWSRPVSTVAKSARKNSRKSKASQPA